MWKNIIKRYFLPGRERLVFKQYSQQNIDYTKADSLYIHVPFCVNTCPYCPYFKEKFNKNKAEEFSVSLLKEIELKLKIIEGKKISSLYIGGGTPTLLNHTLKESIDLLKACCSVDKIAIETNPEEISSKVLDELEHIGCNLLSIGIQDFNKKYLDHIGRKYNPEFALNAIQKAKERNFKTINIDLIFAFPGQTLDELKSSLEIAINTGVDQVTLYPLFTFPYTSIGKYFNINKVVLPDSATRKKFYYHICDTLIANGYEQISVWGFLKNGKTKYSSVTRDYYIGFGPSAATYTGNQFVFNSFNINYYIEQLKTGKFPYAYIMDVSTDLQKLFWLYWRLYETNVPVELYETLFQSRFRNDFKYLTNIMQFMGYIEKANGHIQLNRKGIHSIHLLQNQFALNYVNKIWTESSKHPVPSEIELL